MAEAQDVITVIIDQEAVFKFKDYYDFVYNMIKSRGFDIVEDEFVRKKNEVFIKWSCTRPINPTISFLIKVEQRMTDMKSVKINIGGINELMNKAHVNIVLRGVAVTLWEIKYRENEPKWKIIKGVLDKYFFKQTLDTKKGVLKEEVHFIENEIKSFFDLRKFV